MFLANLWAPIVVVTCANMVETAISTVFAVINVHIMFVLITDINREKI